MQMLITFHLIEWPTGCSCANAHLVTLSYIMNQMLIYMKRVMSDENLFLKIVTAGKLHKKSLVFTFNVTIAHINSKSNEFIPVLLR